MKPEQLTAATIQADVHKVQRQKTRKKHKHDPGLIAGRFSKRAALPSEQPFLEIYQKESCPYSQRVRKTLTRLSIDFVAHNVPKGDLLKSKRLAEVGGKNQIPFMIDHRTGVQLYESNSIVEYLTQEYGKEESLAEKFQTFSEEVRSVVRNNFYTVSNLLREARKLVYPKRKN